MLVPPTTAGCRLLCVYSIPMPLSSGATESRSKLRAYLSNLLKKLVHHSWIRLILASLQSEMESPLLDEKYYTVRWARL